MNAVPPHVSEAAAAAELARLVPAPCVPELSDDRQRALRGFLLNEIDATTRKEVTVASSAHRRTRRLALVCAVGVVALGAAVAVAVLTDRAAPTPPGPGAAATAGMVAVEPASATPAGPILARIAAAAAHELALAPRADQFVYIRSIVAFTHPAGAQTLDGTRVLDTLHQREVWLAQGRTPAPDQSQTGVIVDGKPQQLLVTGYIRENGKTSPIYGSELGTTYAQLAALPTDAAVLLRRIHVLTKGRSDADAAAFDYIGSLLKESLAPPAVTAALYRAAAMIPGVVIVPDAVDAAGRHGFGVARVAGGERYEWIFDEASMLYLGERDYLVSDTSGGKAGMLTGTTAVLARGIVDRPGQLPSSPVDAVSQGT